MAGFIPEIATRVSTNIHCEKVDSEIDRLSSDEFLGKCPSIIEELRSKRDQLKSFEKPISESVANLLKSNQETIISRKHYITGMMASSVDISEDGTDYIVGNTAMSVDGFPYPLGIEKGTSSHWIAPVTFEALHWTDSEGEHFSRGHRVPGIKPDPFVQASIDDTIHQIKTIVNDLKG